MKLGEIYSKIQTNPIISFEIFPPQNDENGEKTTKLFEEVKHLKTHTPALISVTYGAGGSNKDTSFAIVKTLANDKNINVMPHFTCVCSSKNYIQNSIKELNEMNIKNILAFIRVI